MEDDVADHLAFGKRKIRSKYIIISYLILIGLLSMVVITSALGTFIFSYRRWARNNAELVVIIQSVTGVSGFVLYIVVSTLHAIRISKPLNIILLFVVMALFAVSAFCCSAVLDVGVVLGVSVTPVVMMLAIVILALFLEVSRYPLYLVSLVAVMAPCIGGYVHLYISDNIHWPYMVFAPLFAFFSCAGIIANTVWTLKVNVVEEMKLTQNDYIQEAVYICVGRVPFCRCCSKKEDADA